MDRDRLERYLAEGLSLEAIGVLENRDPSTVGYWVESSTSSQRPSQARAQGGVIARNSRPLSTRADNR